MRKKKQLMKTVKYLTLLVAVMAMIAGTILNNISPVLATNKIADLGTSMSYTESLGDNYSTKYSGRVWTDKSVFSDSVTFPDSSKTVTIDTSEEDFLVSFSALATSEQITGQTQAPIDVVFIIDISGSMSNQNSSMDNGYSRIYNTVVAVNDAIDELMALNPYTRVAVAAYSSTATTLLPLDRYTKTVDNDGDEVDYFTLNRSTASNNYAELTTRAINSSGNTIESETDVEGGTNIQLGLYQGMKILADNEDIYATIEGQQVKRTPSVILLSDGSPTYSSGNTNNRTSNWWAPLSNYNDGPGSSPYYGNGFKALMTGAYMKQAIDETYELTESNVKTSLYTVGMGITGLDNYETQQGNNWWDDELEVYTGEQDLANITLNPADYWDADNEMAEDIVAAWNTYTTNNGTPNVEVNNNDTYRVDHPTTGEIYTADDKDALETLVDEYYPADNASAVTSVFETLVSTIALSAPAVPTEIKVGGTIADSGYITYTDPIGQYMEVKAIKSLIFGDQEWNVQDGDMTVTKTENGTVTTYALSSSTKVNTYVHGEQDVEDIKVSITTDASGNQTLEVKIPASLIPLRVNYVTLDKTGAVTDHTQNGATPIRLVYSVGMQEDVIVDGVVNRNVVSDAYAQANANEDGTINFYTNMYTGRSESVIHKNGVTETIHYGDATAQFEPAHTNKFYYMTEPVPLYEKINNQYVQKQGTSESNLSDDAKYYYLETYYHGSQLIENWVERTGAQLKQTDIISSGGYLYRADGSPRINHILEFEGTKIYNNTETAEDFYYPTFEYASGSSDAYAGQYVIYLGNNGVLSANASGTLKISKDVVIPAGLTPDVNTFTFTINFNEDAVLEGTFSATHFNADGSVKHTETITDRSTVTLADGEYIEIYNLAPGTTYTITEGTVAGYTTTVDGVTTKTASGTIEAGVTSTADFVNTYNVSPITYPANDGISGTKTLDGRPFKDTDTFQFEIRALTTGAPSFETTIDTVDSNDEASNNGYSKEFNFGQVTFTQPGTYIYQVLEKEPDDTSYIAGITYSRALYNIAFEVEDNGDGTLSVTKTITQLYDDPGNSASNTEVQAINFKNVYDADSVKLNLVAIKNYEDTSGGNPLTNGMFEFTLTPVAGAPMPTGASGPITLPNIGTTVTFPEIEYTDDLFGSSETKTYQYQIKEVNEGVAGMQYDASTINVTVTIRHTTGDAKVVIEKVEYSNGATTAVFNNTYDPTDVTKAFDVTKVMEGRDLRNEEFSFTLEAVTEGAPMPTSATAKNDTSGKVQFGNITFDKVGTYTYTIKEDATNDTETDGITYDPKTITVTVVVTDNNGVLEATVEYSETNPKFTNVYDADDADPISISATKHLEGKTLEAGKHFFVVEPVELAPLSDDYIVVTNDANGNINLIDELVFTAAGEYQYKIYEQIPTGATLVGSNYVLNGITYDNTYYIVTIEVTDDGNGKLARNATVEKYTNGSSTSTTVGLDEIEFNNTYKTENSIITVPTFNKVLEGFRATGLQADEFTFYLFMTEIKDASGNEVDRDQHVDYVVPDTNHPVKTYTDGTRYITATNNADGTITFGTLTFKEEGTFTFRVAELNDGKEYIDYSTNAIEVTYKVKDNGNGQLVATITNISGEYTFTNKYNSEGLFDDLEVTKNFTGREWLDSDKFEFVLEIIDPDTKAAVDNGDIELPTNLTITATNADTTPSFDPIKFNKAGTYNFVVREKDGDIIGVNYDATSRDVVIDVVDNGDGTLTATLNTTASDKLEFNNVYDADSTILSGHHYLQVSKTIDGRSWLSTDEFVFELTAYDDVTKTAFSNGKIKFIDNTANEHTSVEGDKMVLKVDRENYSLVHFDNIEFDAVGTYKFIVSEVKGTIPSVTYSEDKYIATIVVENDNAKGELVITSVEYEKQGSDEDITNMAFTNVYRPDSVDVTNITIAKAIDGRNWLDGDVFNFTLVAGDETTTTALNNDEIIFEGGSDRMTVQIGATTTDHKATFGKVTFKKAGVYTFHITENDINYTGMVKDPQTLEVIVTVIDDTVSGDLVITETTPITYVGNITFTNTFTPEPTDVTLKGTKELTGRTLVNGEFRFHIEASEETPNAPLPNITTVVNGVEENVNAIAFEPIRFTQTGTYKYRISELEGNIAGITYDANAVIATVVIGQDPTTGQLTKAVSYAKENGGTELVFNNTYQFLPSEPVSISATKVVTPTIGNIYTMVGKEFEFVVEPGGKNNPIETQFVVKNDINGIVNILDGQVFDQPGTYTYVVSEKADTSNGVFIYDDEVYTITVDVVDNTATGKLETTVTITNKANEPVSAIVFDNGYDPHDASVLISGHKVLESDHKELEANEFKFEIVGVADDNGNLPPMPDATSARNTATGFFQFSTIHYKAQGTYTYKVSEVNEGKTGYDYDNHVYTVIVTVADNSTTHHLEATVEYQLGENDADGIVFENGYTPIPTTYDLLGGLDAVKGIKNLDGRDLKVGEFEFVLKEGETVIKTVKNDENGNFVFEGIPFNKAKTYYFTIAEKAGDLGGVTYDSSTYTVEVVVEDMGGELKVTDVNYYQQDVEKDSVQFNNSYAPAETSITLGAEKSLEGRELTKGEFTFQLKDASGKVLQEKTNGEDTEKGVETVTFDAIEYTEAGEHTYTVSEVEGSLGGVTYDKTVYTVEVKVVDNLDGTLKATVTGGSGLVFTNTYEAEGTKLAITATKKVIGDSYTLKANEFEFVLKDASGKEYTAKNAADGSIVFEEIEFTEAGAYTYTITEIKGNIEGITYDTSAHPVTVTVTDDLKGQLKAEITSEAVVIENEYTEPFSNETGDDAPIGLYAGVLGVSAIGLGAFFLTKKKKETEE